MKCASCSNSKRLKAEKRVVKYDECGLTNIVLDGITVYTCPICGEEYFDYGNINQLHSLIKDAIMKRPGVITGPEIRFLRKYFGYSKEYFADILKVDERTIYRWESGRSITPQISRSIKFVFAYVECDRDYDYHDYLLNKKEGKEFSILKFIPIKSGFTLQYT